MTSSPTYVGTPNIKVIANASGTFTALYVGGASGSKVTGIVATSACTAIVNLQIWISSNSTTANGMLTSVPMPITAGQNASIANPPINILSYIPGLPVDNDGQSYIFLANATCQISAQTQGAGNSVTVVCFGGDF